MATRKLFFSYSDYQKDLELYQRINTHFASLKKNKLVTIIDKNELQLLATDKTQVLGILNEADMAIPLLSADFMNNEECVKQLDEAIAKNKSILPIYLREVDISDDPSLKKITALIIPTDGRSILEHITESSDADSILKDITRTIKNKLYPEVAEMQIKPGPKTFYYILAGLVLTIGIIAAFWVHNQLHQVLVTVLVLLMFVCIALLAIKNVLFPTKISI